MLPNWMKRPDRILVRPFRRGERLADDRHVRRVRSVALVEQPAAHQRNAHRREVALAGDAIAGEAGARLASRPERPKSSKLWISSTRVISRNWPLAKLPVPSGKRADQADALDARQRAQPRQEVALERRRDAGESAGSRSNGPRQIEQTSASSVR